MPSNKKLLQAAAGSAGGDNLFVEDVFSTYLYTGNSTARSINNGLDLSGEGGLVWIKNRTSSGSDDHVLYDTERGVNKYISSNSNAVQNTGNTQGLMTFNNNGFSLGTDNYWNVNRTGTDIASWSFRKAKGFFDVVTYTGNATTNRVISHNLGSVPKMILIKNLDLDNRWYFWITGFALNDYLYLNETFAKNNYGAYAYLKADPTSTTVTIDSDTGVNGNNYNFVMYLFGDDAIFGEDGDEQICKMGTATLGGSGTGEISINLGFEPQLVLLKTTAASENWLLVDTMNGAPVFPSSQNYLSPNTSSANASYSFLNITSTGFNLANLGLNRTYIYMAIRRPMKVPEAGTEVFQALTYSGTGTFTSGTDPNSGVATRTISSSLGFDVDMSITKWRSGGSGTPAPSSSLMDRFRGIYNELLTYDTAAETQASNTGPRFSTRASRAFDLHDYGVEQLNKSGQALVSYVFKRAPKFMDMVAFSGNNSVRTISHNLQAVPELMIVKCRSATGYWVVYDKFNTATDYMYLDSTNAAAAFSGYWNNTAPTSTVFTLGTGNGNDTNASGQSYIAYLFATLDGISKVGSYTGTGTGTTVNVDCGFSAGARFVLIKRTDAAGDWFAYDSSRGIVSGDSPYLLFNTAAQEANTDYIDPLSSGFSITPDAAVTNTLNVNNATYIFLAIA